MNTRGAFARLPAFDHPARVERTRRQLADESLDALLITKPVNLRWLVGFTGSTGSMLVTPTDLVFVTDGRYGEQAHAELDAAAIEAEIIVSSAPGTALRDRVSGSVRVGLEANDISWAAMRRFESDWFPHANLVPTENLVEDLRALKDSAEVARIETAAAIADRALAEVSEMIRPGVSEREIATALETAMVRNGADGPAFDTIVASGPNAARPHHHPGSRELAAGDLVIIDMGGAVDGYCSDMTRTFAIGPIDATKQRMIEVVAAAQAAGVKAVRARTAAREVDQAARAVIAEAGWGDQFVHPTGHGLGLEIHEPLRLAATSDATLADGHVVTVEPGIYLPGVGGVRIEDTVEVTADGCRVLTHSARPPLPH